MSTGHARACQTLTILMNEKKHIRLLQQMRRSASTFDFNLDAKYLSDRFFTKPDPDIFIRWLKKTGHNNNSSTQLISFCIL